MADWTLCVAAVLTAGRVVRRLCLMPHDGGHAPLGTQSSRGTLHERTFEPSSGTGSMFLRDVLWEISESILRSFQHLHPVIALCSLPLLDAGIGFTALWACSGSPQCYVTL